MERKEVAKGEAMDRAMWIEIARHLTAIAAAIQRRYTEQEEKQEKVRVLDSSRH